MHVLLRVQQQYPLLGPPSTRMAQALASGGCQCQLSALHLPLHLQELEAAGLGTITWRWHSEQRGIACGCFGAQLCLSQTLTGVLTVVSYFHFSLCFRSVSRASSSNIQPLQNISSTASRCFAFFLFMCMHICDRFAFIYSVSNKTCILSVPDMLNKCKGDLLEVKDNRCKIQPSLLESLVYFVEVRIYYVLPFHFTNALVLSYFSNMTFYCFVFFLRRFVLSFGCLVTVLACCDRSSLAYRRRRRRKRTPVQ